LNSCKSPANSFMIRLWWRWRRSLSQARKTKDKNRIIFIDHWTSSEPNGI